MNARPAPAFLLRGAIALCFFASGIAGAAPFFSGTGELGFPFGQMRGVSPDGGVVVGSGNRPGLVREAALWTQATGLVGLGYPAGSFASDATSSSTGGTVIAGFAFGGPAGFPLAARWTAAGGELLGGFAPTVTTSFAWDLSADGSILVGHQEDPANSTTRAFRWTEAGGPALLPGLEPGSLNFALGISGDGSVVVGGSSLGGTDTLATRWTQAGGTVSLGDLPGGAVFSIANGISGDGSTVVGVGEPAALERQAFIWTEAGGLVGLGYLPGGARYSEAKAVSGDGSVVVGAANALFAGVGSNSAAFIWDEAHGMRLLADVLIQDFGLGAQLAGWRLGEASGISDDGLVIAGAGINPDGNVEGWVVSLRGDPVPAPGSLVLVAAGLVLLRLSRRG